MQSERCVLSTDINSAMSFFVVPASIAAKVWKGFSSAILSVCYVLNGENGLGQGGTLRLFWEFG